MKDEIILLKNFLKNPKFEIMNNKAVFVGKTKDSVLIGPYVDENFDFEAFYKRIISSCVYSKRTYLRISIKMAKKYIETHNIKYQSITNNVMEIFNNGEIINHNILFM